MLKLKRTKKKTELVFHRRESRYSPDFFKGLGLAFLFHLLLFCFFRISFPKTPDESHLLPFTEVDAEWAVVAETVPTNATDHYVIAFEESAPGMIEELMPEISHHKKRPFLEIEPDFSALEGISYTLDLGEEYD